MRQTLFIRLTGIRIAYAVILGMTINGLTLAEIESKKASYKTPSLLSYASFSGQSAALDFSNGERRMARSMRALNSSGSDSIQRARPPEGGKGQGNLKDCLSIGKDGKSFWKMDWDAVFDASGAMNLLSGTLSAWIRPGDSASQGGLWFSGSYAMAGNDVALDSIVWVLGVGKGNALPPLPRIPGEPEIPAKHCFLWTPWGMAVSKEPIPNQEWIHIAAVWDAEKGAKLYINGQEVSEWKSLMGRNTPKAFSVVMRDLFPPPLDRLRIHRLQKGGVNDLRIFDAPLSPSSVLALSEGLHLEDSWHFENIPLKSDTRLARLGWGPSSSSQPIPIADGETLQITKPPILDAREDYRAAGWLAVDGRSATFFPSPYHGYSQSTESTKLTVRYSKPFRPNWISAQGVFEAEWRLAMGERPTFSPRPLVANGFLQQPLGEEGMVDTLLITQKEGLLSEVNLYEIYSIRDTPTKNPETAVNFFWTQQTDAEVPLGPEKRAEWLSSFKPEDRDFSVLSISEPEISAPWNAKALRDIHLFTSPLEEDYAASQIECFLPLKNLLQPARVRLTIHDSFLKRSEIGRYDFLITPDERGQASVRMIFALEDTVFRAGDPLWISLVFEQDVTIGSSASIRIIKSTDSDKVFEKWKRRLLAIWREEMGRISEPRPWQSMDGRNSWWLALTYPQYEMVDRIGQELFRRFPEDPIVRSWFLFTHPQMENLSAEQKLPNPGVHPKWAVLLRENLRLYEEFIAYWTDVRRDPVTGEFGSSPYDDSDLLMDWLDLHLIADPNRKFGDALVTFADKIWNEYKRGDIPYITNGLNTKWTDDLHAYEEGINVQPAAFFARYGDPVIFDRLLSTSRRYDGFLFRRTKDGKLEFADTLGGREGRPFWSSSKPPEGGLGQWWPLILHPGFTALWYSGNPTLEEIMSAIGQGGLHHGNKMDMSDSTPKSAALSALYSHFKDSLYLRCLPGISTGESSQWRWDTTLLGRLDLKPEQKESIYRTSRKDAAERYKKLDTVVLGGADRRFDRNWMEWQLTGKIEHLEEGLAELYKKLKFTMPVATFAEQSGDRVSVPKSLISLCYLGGVAGVRNGYFYPDIAVSYEGFGSDFAGLVLDRSSSHTTVAFYNFHDQPITGILHYWNLLPGTYDIQGMIAKNYSWESMEYPNFLKEKYLQRGESLEITLPPQQVWILKASLKEPSPPLHPRADLALSIQGCQWLDDKTLEAKVWNIGSTASKPAKLVLKDAKGKILAEADIASLDWPKDLKVVPSLVQLRIDKPHTENYSQPFYLNVNNDRNFEEITWLNNSVKLSTSQ